MRVGGWIKVPELLLASLRMFYRSAHIKYTGLEVFRKKNIKIEIVLHSHYIHKQIIIDII